MGKYDNDVEGTLGKDVMKLILDDVKSGKMDQQQMKDFAQRLKPDSIGGKHITRGQADEAEMREILSDWWYLGDFHKMTREEAVKEIVQTLRDPAISLKPLATNIENLLSKKPDDSKEKTNIQLSSTPPSRQPSTAKPCESPNSTNGTSRASFTKSRAPNLPKLNLTPKSGNQGWLCNIFHLFLNIWKFVHPSFRDLQNCLTWNDRIWQKFFGQLFAWGQAFCC